MHNAQAHTSTTYYEQSIHYVLCLLQLLRSALYHFVKVKMSQIVSSNSFHYFKNQFFYFKKISKYYWLLAKYKYMKVSEKNPFYDRKSFHTSYQIEKNFFESFFFQGSGCWFDEAKFMNSTTTTPHSISGNFTFISLISWVQVVWTGNED